MKKKYYNVIGVMSGTSLDGVDLAHVEFRLDNYKWTFEILESDTIGYSQDWINNLKLAVDFTSDELQKLNTSYTKLLSGIITDFIEKHAIENLDAVCSHGHTILHQPDKGLTLQIGNLPEIASLTHQTIVCDFRVQDVKLGGQGAPLVPIGDRILFSEYDFCMNLGGFSNVSFEENGKRIAFDISPVNTVLNYYANHLGLDYDDKGAISKTGKTDETLLTQLNALDFYQLKSPKSLGFEFVKEIVLPLIEQFDISLQDKLRTFTEHVALQISLALKSFDNNNNNNNNNNNKKLQLLVTGGGAYNDFLMERIQYHLPDIKIVIPSAKILEFKEALIFALLGVLKLRNETNALSSVTGAKVDHSSGVIFNFRNLN